jgi:hypothetical protein
MHTQSYNESLKQGFILQCRSLQIHQGHLTSSSHSIHRLFSRRKHTYAAVCVCVGAPKGLTDSFSYTLDIFMKTKFTVVPTHRTPQ